MILVLIYLAAIVVANLSVAAFGPSVTIINAFWLIGLDLTLRDRLHDRWSRDQLMLRMGALIAAGGVISYAVNRDAGQIALASTVAFTVAATLDAVVYSLLSGRSRLVRVNTSNLVGAAADSFLFPAIAFGPPLLWPIIFGQFAAKVLGGFFWSLVLAVPLRRRPA